MNQIGIVGYGAYIPSFRISVEEIAKVWKADGVAIKNGLMVEEKAVPDHDEDTITISVEAARNAMLRAGINPQEVGALFIGSESHPYTVKPSGTIVSDTLGTGPEILIADYEFACKAGTAAMQVCAGLCKAEQIKYGIAIGADTAQGKPGDALEYTAAAGGAAFVIGPDPLATIDYMYSFTTDTPDFWRREGQTYPRHGSRFTGEPGYFKHVISATKGLLDKSGLTPSDFDYAVFHMPNGKFPSRAAKLLGFTSEQIKQGLVVTRIGNSYSGSSIVGLTNVLDIAKPGQRILLTSFGSGAGSDSFVFTVTDKIEQARAKAPSTESYITNKQNISYGEYVKLRGKLKTE